MAGIPQDDEGFVVGPGVATAATQKAICFTPYEEAEAFWVPLSQIHDDSEVWKTGQDGVLIVSSWLARQKGWLDAP